MTGSKQRFQVLSEYSWPSGLARGIAVLAESPDELSARLGIAFLWDEDDLDRLQQAYLRLASGRVVVLRRHAREPNRGTSVYADASDPAEVVIAEILPALSVPRTMVDWTATG